MAPFWSDALDLCLADEPRLKAPRPNPFPPLGSGKKPRPPMLVIPHFTPPPPTPQPLFFFPAPQKAAPKPAPAQKKAEQVAEKPRTKEVQAASNQRRRRAKVWDLIPEIPQPAVPDARLLEPRHAAEPSCAATASWGITRNSGVPAAGAVCSPTAAEVLRRILASDLPPAHMTRDVPARTGSPGALCTAHAGLTPRHPALGCGIDLSFLWSALVELVCSPDPDASKLTQPGCHCRRVAQGTVEAQGAEYSSGACSPRALAKPPVAPLRGSGFARKPSSTSLAALGKGHRASPMSVFSPLGTAKSSASSSPESLLAFLEREPSPLRL